MNQEARALIEAEARIGGLLSPSQRQFVILQSKKNVLLAVGKKRKRTTDEESLLRSLQNKIMHDKRSMTDFDERLLVKLNVKSGAEREAKRRAGQVKLLDRSAAQRKSKSREGRTKEQVEMERSDQRVYKVARRAGGLSVERRADVRAGRKKNKDTAVYSGDALKTKQITEGTFFVDPLTGGSDSLGALGEFTCNHCGALRLLNICHQSNNQICLLFAK